MRTFLVMFGVVLQMLQLRFLANYGGIVRSMSTFCAVLRFPLPHPLHRPLIMFDWILDLVNTSNMVMLKSL